VKPFNPLRAIFFDLDDTLYDHAFAHAHATRSGKAVDAALRDVSFDHYDSRACAILEEIHPSVVAGDLTFDAARLRRYELLADEFGGNRSLAGTQAAAHITAYRTAERAVPGAHELLTALKHGGYALFIVSNNIRIEQEGKLARLGLDHFFDALIVSGDHSFAKPDPRLFAVALQVAGVSAAQATHVGDSYANDIAGAQAAGIRAVWLNRSRQPVPKDSGILLQVVHDFADHEHTFHAITGAVSQTMKGRHDA
jgi:putative hydrolase of the HAD superfamily